MVPTKRLLFGTCSLVHSFHAFLPVWKATKEVFSVLCFAVTDVKSWEVAHTIAQFMLPLSLCSAHWRNSFLFRSVFGMLPRMPAQAYLPIKSVALWKIFLGIQRAFICWPAERETECVASGTPDKIHVSLNSQLTEIGMHVFR